MTTTLTIYALLATLVAAAAVVKACRAVAAAREQSDDIRLLRTISAVRAQQRDEAQAELRNRRDILRERAEWAESQMLPTYAPVTDVHAPSFAHPTEAPRDWSGFDAPR